MNTLDEWEAELKSAPNLDTITQGYGLTPTQGLALIELVRKKDEALKIYADEKMHPDYIKTAVDALALTEELK